MFGTAFLAASLTGVLMPQQALQSAAAFLVCTSAAALFIRRAPGGVRVALPACALALVWLAVYQQVFIAPVTAYAGRKTNVSGVVSEILESSYGLSGATIRIETLDGVRCAGNTSLRIDSLGGVTVGDCVSLTVTPEKTAQNAYRFSRYADGVFLEADEAESCEITGHRNSLVLCCRGFRDELAQKMRWLLHGDTGEIAAAMTVGDRSGLTSSVTDAFRRAGMSHVLVVSGLHLSMVSGFLYSVLRKRIPARASSLAASAATVAFMLTVGLTPSVVRAGTAMLFLYAGRLFRRRSDALTSMGISSLILCAVNPYAAADAGLLLSYCAASTVVWVGMQERRVMRAETRRFGDELPPLREYAMRALFCIAVPAAVAVTTLPVIASIGSGVSAWSVPANLFAVPVAGVVVVLGLLALLFALVPPAAFLADAFSFLCGVGVRILMWIAQAAASAPGGYFRFTDAVHTLPVIAAALLFAAGIRWRVRPCINLPCAAALAAVCFGIQAALGAGVVTVSIVGSVSSPEIVTVSGGEAIVVCRGSADDAAEWLEEHGVSDVALAVCLSEDADRADLEKIRSTLGAGECVGVSERLAASPIRDIMITADTQKNGTYAMLDVGGYTICLGAGTVDFTLLPEADLFIAGAAQPNNLNAGAVLALRPDADWIASCAVPVYTAASDPAILVRPGRSAMLKGVNGI